MEFKLAHGDFVMARYYDKDGALLFLMAKNITGMFSLYEIAEQKAVKLCSSPNCKELEDKYHINEIASKQKN